MADLMAAAVSAASIAALALREVLTPADNFVKDANGGDLDVLDDVEMLLRELYWLQSFLEDTEASGGNINRMLLVEVRDVAYKCTDFVKSFILQSTRLQDLYANSEFPEVERLMELRRSDPYACNEENMVGRLKTICELTTLLLHRGDSGSLFVISIVGMGGIGKTTIAKKLYVSLSQEYFNTCAWIWVSQQYTIKDILTELIKSMTKPTKEDLNRLTDNESKKEYLHAYLSKRRFLVVFDDVWNTDAWNILRNFIPNNGNGSKVIITTRIWNVAEADKNNHSHIYSLRCLTQEESWDLFCRKAFYRSRDDNKCPPYLEKIGREMVTRCSGLPLAIVALGSMLYRRPQNIAQWAAVRDGLWRELERNSDIVYAIVLRSFENLPHYLKPCFLYVSMFPNDVEISISKLMLLWEAEGFIAENNVGCIQDTAKSYFNELVRRSLLIKSSGDWMDSTIRVHPLLRDMVISKAWEMSFSVCYDGDRFPATRAHQRLAVFNSSHSNILLDNYANYSLLRTFRLSETGNARQADSPSKSSFTPFDGLLQSLHTHFRLLTVLDIQLSETRGVPNTIGRMMHLRYLGFRLGSKSVHKLPKTIGSLLALQTLAIESDKTVTLPRTMGKLKRLKYLTGNFRFLGGWITDSVCLERLEGISYEQWCRIDTSNLVNLRHLRLINVRPEGEHAINILKFYDNFENLSRLQWLAVENSGDGTGVSSYHHAHIFLSTIFVFCPNISHLRTTGISFDSLLYLERFAIDLQVLDITLDEIQTTDPMSSLEKLPRLTALRLNLRHGISGEEMVFSEGFSRLITLTVVQSSHCKFILKEECMPLLENFDVDEPGNFEAPSRLKKLITTSSRHV